MQRGLVDVVKLRLRKDLLFGGDLGDVRQPVGVGVHGGYVKALQGEIQRVAPLSCAHVQRFAWGDVVLFYGADDFAVGGG